MIELLSDCLSGFNTISLSDLQAENLLERSDIKFIMPLKRFPNLLNSLQDHYHLLRIDGTSILPYRTEYFDTPDYHMYLSHHNGRLNRYKIRRRKYLVSGFSYLEVKHKINKGITLKKRIPVENMEGILKLEEMSFIEKHTPYPAKDLIPTLTNSFERLTLVNMTHEEKCTFDIGLAFYFNGSSVIYDKIVVGEIKRKAKNEESVIQKTLRDARIYSTRFSKYCIGMAVLTPGIKYNNFKKTTNTIGKIT